jgi:hypothetical protein
MLRRWALACGRRPLPFAGPALPIPAVLELGEAFDGYYAIAERVYGGYIDDVDEAQMRSLLPALLAALDAMRLADLSHTTGYGGWDVAGNAPHVSWRSALLDVANDRPGDRIHGWRARLAASAMGSGPFDVAYRRLESLAGGLPDVRCLIHSDLLHYNVLVEGERITGVLDWGCAMTGDFLYDLAWLCFWQPWYSAWQRIRSASCRKPGATTPPSAWPCPASSSACSAASCTSGWPAWRIRPMLATGLTWRTRRGVPWTWPGAIPPHPLAAGQRISGIPAMLLVDRQRCSFP